jgi:hypothetical protein
MADVKERLIHIGGKLAVLGIAASEDAEVPDMEHWHIMRPGTWSAPQIGAPGNAGIVVGRTVCGKHAYTNGYAADFHPPAGATCKACRAQM